MKLFLNTYCQAYSHILGQTETLQMATYNVMYLGKLSLHFSVVERLVLEPNKPAWAHPWTLNGNASGIIPVTIVALSFTCKL